MDNKLDFSLPEKKAKSAWTSIALVLLVSVILVQSIVLLRSNRGVATGSTTNDTSLLTAEQTKALATKLSQRSLYGQAADLWKTYLAQAELTPPDRAKALFQVALMLEKAERFDEAIAYFYRSELTAELDDLASDIDGHLKTCFEKLGRFSALRYELMSRTNLQGTETVSGTVVAEIGPEKLTEADLTSLIEETIDQQLAPMSAYMTPEQINAQKKQMLEQFKTSQARQQFLRQHLAQELLYRRAVEQDLLQDAAVKQQLNNVTRSVLAQQLMNRELASKINPTESDLKTYYTANQAQYKEPEKARIRRILVDSEETAKDVIQQHQEGTDFVELVKAYSQDPETKAKEGVIETAVEKGSYVPLIGSAPELNTAIFAALPGTLVDTPYQSEHGWEVIKVDSQQPARQKAFDEVRQQVMQSLMQQKQQEVQQDLIQQLMDEYNAVIHTSAFSSAQER